MIEKAFRPGGGIDFFVSQCGSINFYILCRKSNKLAKSSLTNQQ